MATDGLSADEIELFFKNGGTGVVSVGPKAAATTEEPIIDTKLAKFVKMLKMNLPEGAVRQKMATDGLSADEIDAFFAGGGTGAVPVATPTLQVSPNDKFLKYQKLAKTMPEGAIRSALASHPPFFSKFGRY